MNFNQGFDTKFASDLIQIIENKCDVFSDAERDLIISFAYHIGNNERVEQLATKIAGSGLDEQTICTIAGEIERISLDWAGISNVEEIELEVESCSDADYVLENGVVLSPCGDDSGQYESGNISIDGSYIMPHRYTPIFEDGNSQPVAFHVASERQPEQTADVPKIQTNQESNVQDSRQPNDHQKPSIIKKLNAFKNSISAMKSVASSQKNTTLS